MTHAWTMAYNFPVIRLPENARYSRTESSFRPAFAVVALLVASPPAFADLSIVEVSAAQHVTVIGRTASLKSVVEDVCWRAGVSIDFFDAEDRPFGGSFRDVPFEIFLRRILSEESYIAGSSTGSGGRVTWLRVLGDPAVGWKRRAMGGGSGRRAPLDIPPMLVETAFTNGGDEAERREALAVLTARIAGDPVELRSFLATDSGLIAETLAQYRGAAAALAELAASQEEPRIRAKLAEILAALTKRHR